MNVLQTNLKWIDKYKVFIPRAGSGSDSFPHPILGHPFVVEPNTACTETYIVAGAFGSRKEAEQLASYIRTRFFRFLVAQFMYSHHITKDAYSFVPVLDMNINWTDEKLYKKYGLTKDEIAFIESKIRPMEACADEADREANDE
jgi:site-specific DNA-methyltransferase (adenine-specific)